MRALRGCVRLRAFVFAAALLGCQYASAADLRVFAAASLTDALDEALTVCAAQADISAIGVYAGSGTIARQIEQGAPADIYISANPQWMDWLEERDRIAKDTRVDLVGNKLVLVRREDVPLVLIGSKNWFDLITEQRFAIANSSSVPAGLYAKQYLENVGLWERLNAQQGLLEASNVRESLTWVMRGEAGYGIVYSTDVAKTERLAITEIDEGLHDPIRYPAAVIADNDGTEARRLLACLQGEEASDVFKSFGFSLLAE